MSPRSPIYLLAPPGPERDRLAGATGAVAAEFDDLESFLPPGRHEPGLVLLPPSLPAADAGGAIRALAGLEGWMPALVVEGDDGPRVLSVVPGYAYRLEDVLGSPEGGGGEPLLDLGAVVERVRVARHDINNPLAAAFAETQLLLLDAPAGETRESLEVILEQLRRIKELVATLRSVRPPREGRPGG